MTYVTDTRKPQSLTDYIIIFYSFFLGSILIGYIFYLIFAPPVYENFLFSGVVILWCSLVFGGLKLIKKAMNNWHLKHGTGRLEQVRHEMLVGLGGVTFCGLYPRVAVFFIQERNYPPVYFTTSLLLAAFIFHYIFNFGHNRWCKYQHSNQWIPHMFIFIFNILFFILAIRFGASTSSESQQVWSVGTQIALGIISTGSSIELFTVYNNELCLKGTQEVNNPEKIVADIPDNFTSAIMPSCIFMCTIILITLGCIFVYTKSFTWPWIGITSISCLVICVFIVLIQYALYCGVLKYMKASSMTWLKVQLLVGFGGIMICSMAPRILIYFIDMGLQNLSYALLTSFIASTFIYIVFIGHSKCWTLNVKNHLALVYILIFLNFTGFVTSIRIAVSYENSTDAEIITYFQIAFTLPSAASMIDFALILGGALESKGDHGITAKVRSGKTVKVIKTFQKKLTKEKKCPEAKFECKICTQEYNDLDRIPRILKECGHTLCGSCAEQILKNNYMINCPFCQTVTVVNGSASNLPKNYEVLGVV